MGTGTTRALLAPQWTVPSALRSWDAPSQRAAPSPAGPRLTLQRSVKIRSWRPPGAPCSLRVHLASGLLVQDMVSVCSSPLYFEGPSNFHETHTIKQGFCHRCGSIVAVQVRVVCRGKPLLVPSAIWISACCPGRNNCCTRIVHADFEKSNPLSVATSLTRTPPYQVWALRQLPAVDNSVLPR